MSADFDFDDMARLLALEHAFSALALIKRNDVAAFLMNLSLPTCLAASS